MEVVGITEISRSKKKPTKSRTSNAQWAKLFAGVRDNDANPRKARLATSDQTMNHIRTGSRGPNPPKNALRAVGEPAPKPPKKRRELPRSHDASGEKVWNFQKLLRPGPFHPNTITFKRPLREPENPPDGSTPVFGAPRNHDATILASYHRTMSLERNPSSKRKCNTFYGGD